jgi:hypothetical protein
MLPYLLTRFTNKEYQTNQLMKNHDGTQAHGGLDRWNTFDKVSASFITGGGLMPMKGVELPATALVGVASMHEETRHRSQSSLSQRPLQSADRDLVLLDY